MLFMLFVRSPWSRCPFQIASRAGQPHEVIHAMEERKYAGPGMILHAPVVMSLEKHLRQWTLKLHD